MSLIRSHCWTLFFVVPLSATALLASAAAARATTMTYRITSLGNPSAVVYPDNLHSSLTDTLSGTITVSSAATNIFNTWTSSNVSQITTGTNNAITLSYNLSMSNSSVSDDNNIQGNEDLAALFNTNHIQNNSVTFNSSGIFMSDPDFNGSGGQVALEAAGSGSHIISITWGQSLFAFGQPSLSGADIEILGGLASTPPVTSLYGSGASWQIAASVAAPEPGTFWLSAVGLLGIGGALSLRRLRGGKC